MKTKLMALVLLAGGAMFAQTRFSVGVSVGSNRGYYAPAYTQAIPPCPGPGYFWANGYWNPPVRSVYRAAPRIEQHYYDRNDRHFDRRDRHERNDRFRGDRW